MEDIFLNDPRQTSAQNIARKQKGKKPAKRRFREYLVDLVVKSLLLAAVFALDFTLFAEAGSYNLFSSGQELTPEAGWIYAAIAVGSFALIFLFSFSLTLQNFLIGVGSAITLLAIFNQFARFDQTSILASYFNLQPYSAVGDILSHYSHFVLAAILLFAVFIFLTFARRSTQVYLLGTLLLICGGLMSAAYFNPVSRHFDNKSALGEESSHPNGRNFVYIALPNAPTYHKLQNLNKDNKNNDLREAADNVLGFYMQNNFTYYPYSYIEQGDQPYMNLAATLNPNAKNATDYLLSDVLLDGYWDFNHLGNERLYLKENRVFNTFHKNDYNLRAYQNGRIDLCNINSRLSANRCIEKVELPISFNGLGLSLPQKIAILSSEWLESTGLIPSISPILGIISSFEREVAPLHFQTSQLSGLNSFKQLKMLADDIASDKGNNAYFVALDLPSDLFIYDALCNLKPISRWISDDDQDTPLMMRYAAAAEQTSCLYGQLENFMQQLQKNNKLKNTVVVIQGTSVPFSAPLGLEKDLFKSLQNNRQGGIAIYDPLKDQSDIDYRLCTAPAILRSYLYKKDCSELEGYNITDQLRKDILATAEKQKLSNRQIEKSRNNFRSWYSSWAAHNQTENLMAEEVIPLQKAPDEAEIIPEKEIKAVPEAKTAEESAPETTAPQTISEAAKQEAVPVAPKNAVAPTPVEEKPLPKPEQLKNQLKAKIATKTTPAAKTAPSANSVNVSVKVIDSADK